MTTSDSGAPPRVLGIKRVHLPLLRKALAHNMRHMLGGAYVGPGIDVARMHLNAVVAGPPTHEAALSLLDEQLRFHANAIPKRKDATGALEMVASLPAGFKAAASFWPAFVAWAESFTGAVMLSAVVHNDQAHPHCHVLLLPVVAGRWVGALLMRDYRKALASFDLNLAGPFGLRVAPMSCQRMAAALQAARKVLEDANASPDALALARMMVAAAPAVESNGGIGLLAPDPRKHQKRRPKTMASIFTGPGRKTHEDKGGGVGWRPIAPDVANEVVT